MNFKPTITFPKAITYSDDRPHTSIFRIAPLTAGFGYSIGNALRRTLIAHTPTASPAIIRIRGVVHEFAVVPGIKEDMLILKSHLRTMPIAIEEEFDEPIHLKISLPAESRQIRAGDLPTPHGLTFTQPDHYLFTLTGHEPVELELWFICGRASDDPSTIKQKIALIETSSESILIEPLFKPVNLVALNVAPIITAGKSLESLELTVTTNSSITPMDAFQHATRAFFDEISLAFSQTRFVKTGEHSDGHQTLSIDLKQPITILAINPRIIACLEELGIKTVGDVVSLPRSVIENTPALTDAVINSINVALEFVDKNLCIKSLRD
jgi:DNA-directed RNA polymerase subunit alpha